MQLRTLVFIAAIAYTIVIGGSMLLYRLIVVYPELESSTLDLHNGNLLAIYSTYAHDSENLSLFTNDWAKWDEIYNYVENPDSGFIKRNLNGNFKELNIDGIAILDSAATLKLAAIKANDQIVQVPSLTHLSNDLRATDFLYNPTQFGLIWIGDKLGYFASSAIQNSEMSKSPNGTLIFTRFFKNSFFERVHLYTDARISIYTLKEFQQRHPDIQAIDLEEVSTLKTIQDSYFINIKNQGDNISGVLNVQYDKAQLPRLLDKATLISIFALVLLPIIITFVTWHAFLLPVNNMFRQLKTMENEGSATTITTDSHIWELQTFASTFNGLVAKITNYQDKLENDSKTDGLTQIFNRRHFDETFDTAWRFSTRNKIPISIIMVDIDFFKKYNDHYGHQQGDEALKQVANILQQHARRANDVLARYGGEEFILMHQPDSREHLKKTLNAILESINEAMIPHETSGVCNHITVSAGACLVDEPGGWMKDYKELAVKVADQALYKAKNKGRNTFHLSRLDPACNV